VEGGDCIQGHEDRDLTLARSHAFGLRRGAKGELYSFGYRRKKDEEHTRSVCIVLSLYNFQYYWHKDGLGEGTLYEE
jgi:hypothetical protein